ncbi:MAG: hypothetical protein ACI9W4_000983 [Rhodothermales bacterium]|jgi:hypothetical protein
MRFLLVALILSLPGLSSAQVSTAVPHGAALSQSELRSALLAGTSTPVEGEGWSPRLTPRLEEKARSVPLAFGMSALVPGAGQAYNRSWTKAAVALGLEAAVFTVWSVTKSKGLSQEDDFRAFAHQGWDPAKYSNWLNDYVVYLSDEFGHTVSGLPATAPSGIDMTRPDAWTAQQRAAVNVFFSQMQAIERQVFHPETLATFSHQIPGFGEQQYYELIGKYFQFAPGWGDYPDWRASDGTFTPAIDPERTGEGGSKPNVSPTFYRYADDHAAAQDLLRTASHLSSLFVVNHLLAAIDAAVTAKLRNDRISTSLTLAYDAFGPPSTRLSVVIGL